MVTISKNFKEWISNNFLCFKFHILISKGVKFGGQNLEEKEVLIHLAWYFHAWSWFNAVIGKGTSTLSVLNKKFYVLPKPFPLVWSKLGPVFNVGVEFLCRIHSSSSPCCTLCHPHRSTSKSQFAPSGSSSMEKNKIIHSVKCLTFQQSRYPMIK